MTAIRALDQVDALRAQVRGPVVLPADASYDEDRRVWNGMVDRRPAAIVRALGSADVAAAVRFAREQDLPLSVRCGGHNVTGNAVCDHGLTIDLSLMRGVRVGPRSRTVRVQGGALLGDVDHEAQSFGLVVPAGIVSHTGAGGLALGGGIGYLARRFGLTADNLLSADVVTTEGDVVRASEDENPDLLWGLRGGGGNFGVVTSFEFRAHRVGPVVLAGLIGWPLERGREVLEFFRDFAEDAPDELGLVGMLRIAPPAPFVPPAFHGHPIVGVLAHYSGAIADGERALRPLREFGPPGLDTVQPMPHEAFQRMLDPTAIHGRRHYMKAHDLPDLTDPVLDALLDGAAGLTSPHTIVPLFRLGGAVGRVPEDATAYSHRDARYAVTIDAGWEDSDDERHIDWVRRTSAALEPHAAGVYVNFLGNEGQARVRAAYGEAKYRRLAALKAKYDPANVFRMNQNIEPAAS